MKVTCNNEGNCNEMKVKLKKNNSKFLFWNFNKNVILVLMQCNYVNPERLSLIMYFLVIVFMFSFFVFSSLKF